MRIALAAVVMTCVAAAASAAEGQVQPPQDRINTALARARQVGIPVALLESKVAEGKAKGVSLERIAAAVARREASLERASQAIKGKESTSPAELTVAADAVESGVSDAVLKAVAESAPRDRRAVAIAALTQLVQLGHVPEAALERVKEALKRGPEALLDLPGQAGRGRANGQSPDAAGGRGDTRGGGPPASVPAPGTQPEQTKPKGPPSDPGRPTTTPGSGRGSAL